jgi:delta-aminolevulinic acid dehydratase/porphobilinogen synthase
MPGVYRWGVNRLKEALDGPVKDGLAAVLLFGVIDVSARSP